MQIKKAFCGPLGHLFKPLVALQDTSGAKPFFTQMY